ncbi:hypothetical protein OH77DRAFT_751248 [Trametes cingulata]|nr:hypothetical protein OH77DRAFT_751248 [Trametes cingulata]
MPRRCNSPRRRTVQRGEVIHRQVILHAQPSHTRVQDCRENTYLEIAGRTVYATDICMVGALAMALCCTVLGVPLHTSRKHQWCSTGRRSLVSPIAMVIPVTPDFRIFGITEDGHWGIPGV